MGGIRITLTYLQSPLMLVLCAGGLLVLAALMYVRFLWGPRRRYFLILTFLRWVALCTGLLILLKPVFRYEKVVRQHQRIAVLVDGSRSMAVTDALGGRARFDTARQLCESPAMGDLAQAFSMEYLRFSEALSPYNPDGTPDGEDTLLADALAGAEQGAVPLAAIVLITDGRHTVLEQDLTAPVPVWTVPVGSGRGVWNATVRDIQVEPTVLIGTRIDVEAVCERAGDVPPGVLEAALMIGEREIEVKDISSGEGGARVRFSCRAEEAGLLLGQVVVRGGGGDAFPEDDVRHFFVEVVKERLPVLMYEPTPRWECKFAVKSLRADRNLDVVTVIRTAGDQLLVEGTPPTGLRGGLPAGSDDFEAYAVIVLGDTGPGDFLAGQGDAVCAYVDQGGGLLVMGGRKNLLGGLAASGLQVLLPAQAQGPPETGSFGVRVRLATHPALRGIVGAFAGADGAAGFPVRDLVPLGQLTPGAEVVLAAAPPGIQAARPMLVVQRYGKGRVAVLGTGSTWTWAMQHAGVGGTVLHERFWGQLVRWLAGRGARETEGRLSLSKRVLNVGEELGIRLHGAEKDPGPVEIRGPGGAVTLALQAHAGRHEATFRPRVPGKYEIVRSHAGVLQKELVIVAPSSRERDSLTPDTDVLYQLSRRTGGGLVRIPQSRELGDRILRSFPGAVQEVEETPERNPLLFILFILAVSLEWVLRRRVLTV